MAIDRLERVNALLRREIAEALPAVMSNADIDLAAVMITGVQVSRNLRHALVSVSILGHENERGSMLGKLTARHAAFQRLINRDIRLKYTPVLQFKLDTSVEKGDHVLDLLAKMEAAEAPALNPEP
ncbi:MAG: 30S ribosome-binding factor RbfA [Kiritimatiellae bacterium]|nr:30S ribosome-binding factor RbfA [Kiritimatiellia bacterium]